MNIADNLAKINASISKDVTLVAVSKTKPLTDIEAAYAAGQRIFGENKIQEMTAKWEALPKDIQWHMIGHVQSNKVKYMAPYVSLIHGVDRSKLLREINKQGAKHNRIIDCLLQIHIAQEDSKFGLDEIELKEIIAEQVNSPLPHVRIVGLMGMATYTKDAHQIQQEFRYLKSLYDSSTSQLHTLTTLSMGMSGDFNIAIEEGSTMIRVGSKIFGERNY
ncbi:MAG: YggS family pyridoxal phosphate-dependent enzyme [Flavobacteriaceae bacterium]